MAMHILGDWGSTRLRLWLVNQGEVEERADGPGIGALQQSPAATLGTIMAPWLATGRVQRIVLCGMAGARGALHEAGYVDCPAGVDDWRSGAAHTMFGSVALRIGAGLACRSAAGVADVMRGEETQMFGAIALDAALSQGRHRIILPGTHSKWIELADGRITGFRTFPTGELFALLQRSSLLAPPRTGASQAQAENTGFAAGIARAQDGSGLLGKLFEARAGQLRDGRSPEWAEGFVSGLIIGSEVNEMLRINSPHGAVTIIGDPRLAARYEAALNGSGVQGQRGDGDGCVLAGLRLLDADD